mmetsp:Transcript_82962/g.179106  ORF Transcript_82962/g.179106 Transcript_82962/m.179106 type:complete len:128 (+) Transcript_82962:460-843(+)
MGDVLVVKSHQASVDDPVLATVQIAQAAKKLGATFQHNSNVARIVLNTAKTAVDKIILDNGDEILCPILINAAGPNSNRITELIYKDNDLPNDCTVSTEALRTEVILNKLPYKLKSPLILLDRDIGF